MLKRSKRNWNFVTRNPVRRSKGGKSLEEDMAGETREQRLTGKSGLRKKQNPAERPGSLFSLPFPLLPLKYRVLPTEIQSIPYLRTISFLISM
jgi:hypothetical protein